MARSELGDGCTVASERLEMKTKVGETFLAREIVDRPHLYGILDRLNGLGLEPLSVETLPGAANRSSGGTRGPKGTEI